MIAICGLVTPGKQYLSGVVCLLYGVSGWAKAQKETPEWMLPISGVFEMLLLVENKINQV